MGIFTLLTYDLLLRPLYNILLICLQLFQGNLGRAIIVLTLITRLIVAQFTGSPTAMQEQMGAMQPKMQAIQDQYKDNPEKQSEEMMNLLKKEGAGPLKGCLGMLIQMPVFLGLYAVVSNIADPINMQGWMKFGQKFMDMSYSFLYPYVSTYIDPANIDTFFLFFNTTAKQNIGLAAFAALLMYANMQLMQVVKPTTLPTLPGQEKQPDMAQMMGSMNIILVVMIGGFVYSAPAGIGLYIVTSTLVGVVQMARQNRLLLQAKRASRNSSNIIIGK